MSRVIFMKYIGSWGMFNHFCSDVKTVEFKDFLKYAFNVLKYRYRKCVQWIKIILTYVIFPLEKSNWSTMVPKSSVWKHSSIDVFQDCWIAQGVQQLNQSNNVLFLYVNDFKWQTEITLSNQDTIHLHFKKQNRYDQ